MELLRRKGLRLRPVAPWKVMDILVIRCAFLIAKLSAWICFQQICFFSAHCNYGMASNGSRGHCCYPYHLDAPGENLSIRGSYCCCNNHHRAISKSVPFHSAPTQCLHYLSNVMPTSSFETVDRETIGLANANGVHCVQGAVTTVPECICHRRDQEHSISISSNVFVVFSKYTHQKGQDIRESPTLLTICFHSLPVPSKKKTTLGKWDQNALTVITTGCQAYWFRFHRPVASSC